GELRNGTFYPTGSYAFSHPTGTGPFKFKSWTVGEKVELVKNRKYWGMKPKIDRVIIRPISNNTARVQALQTGEINGADLIQPQDVPTIKSSSKLKLLDRPPFNVAYVTINQSRKPFDKLAVRQAVAYGLDRLGEPREVGLQGDGEERSVAPGLREEREPGHRGRHQPDRLDGRLRRPGQLRRNVLQGSSRAVGLRQQGHLQHPRQSRG